MTRRADAHDYSRPGIYHITIRVADGLGMLFGNIIGSNADEAAVTLTTLGTRIEHELLTSITTRYPMITIDTYVIMPEHMHFILIVRDPIISSSGRSTHLGQVIAGFKTGCNRIYWGATAESAPVAKPQGTQPPTPAASVPGASTPTASNPAASTPATSPPAAPLSAASTPTASTPATSPPAASVPGGSAAGKARFSTGRPPLFAPGYCDVMPIEEGQLETQRAYILNNPKSRWLRTHDRSRLQPQRGGIDTALTPSALRGYLQRECPPFIATPAALSAIERRLLLADGKVTCDTYGDRALLQRRLLPVVCHRGDNARRDEQKARCIEEAAQGAVLVSPRIAKGEQAIIDEAVHHGFPVVLIADNGFPAIYHPSAERLALCAEDRLLLVTPWQYEYQSTNEQITTLECKAMNCVAQALCRTKDSWWKK